MKLKISPAGNRPGLFDRLKILLKKSGSPDEKSLEEIEEILISSDAGAGTAAKITGSIRDAAGEGLQAALRSSILGVFAERQRSLNMNPSGLTVIMAAGVNGTGKTTTVGKLARHFKNRGMKTLLAAGDTFRAGAVEQAETWARRAGAGIVKHRQGSDPSAVAYDAVEAAVARGVDVLLVDTAGRLHTSVNLMAELRKMRNVIAKKLPGAPHETVLVIDASAGQNALAQARIFTAELGVSSLALVKLDGTAKGGIVLAIEDELGVPVKIVGTGEAIEDIEFFDPVKFVDGLLT